jgi:4,5-DOPA dioxygenase extradiol
MLPALFVSHGAPDLPLAEAPATRFLSDLGRHLAERPRAILIASAHWETREPTVNAVAVNDTIHDFNGFPAELYSIRYAAPGSGEVAAQVVDVLNAHGLPCAIDPVRGLDHGAWVPLMLAYPDADVPVLQISVQTHLGPAHSLAVGRALASLRATGVLVVGSGSFTHDLSEFRNYRNVIAAPEPEWVTAFADWFDDALARGATADLLAYRRLAPFAAKNHPTEEHLLPLFVALGAGGENARSERLHASVTHGVLRMDVYAFGGRQ